MKMVGKKTKVHNESHLWWLFSTSDILLTIFSMLLVMSLHGSSIKWSSSLSPIIIALFLSIPSHLFLSLLRALGTLLAMQPLNLLDSYLFLKTHQVGLSSADPASVIYCQRYTSPSAPWCRPYCEFPQCLIHLLTSLFLSLFLAVL